MSYRYRKPEEKEYMTVYRNGSRLDNSTGELLPSIPLYGTAMPKTSAAAGAAADGNDVSNGTKSRGVSAAGVKTSVSDTAAQIAARRKAALDSTRQQTMKLLGQNLEAEKAAAKLSNEEALRQLYIAYMQGIKNMAQQTALWGAGGEIESLKTQQRLNYEDNRARQNTAYSSLLSEIQQRYNEELLELENEYLGQLMNL